MCTWDRGGEVARQFCVCEGTRSLHDCVLASALLHVNVPLLVNVPASVCMYSAVCVK